MPFSVRNSTAPRPGRIRDFHHGLLGNLANLTSLQLHRNRLSGPIPPDLGNLMRLTSLGIDRDTGLCLPRDFPANAPFGRLAREQGVAACLGGGDFTDDPIVAGVTAVRAVHFEELRARIDELRVTHDLGRFPWTDPGLEAGVTPIKAVHVSEFRTALREVYTAAARPPEFDSGGMQPGAAIRAADIETLRRAIRTLE